MKQIILLTIISSLSCNNQPENNQTEFEFPDYSILTKEFEKELIKTITQLNAERADSVLASIVIDTLFLFTMKNSRVYSGLAQYRTKDNKMKLGIIGIGNIGNEHPPTYVLLDNKPSY